MEITLEQDGGVTIVTLPGDQLDAGNAAAFKRDIAAAIAGSASVVFDMSRLQFVDSSGLGAILSCLRQLNAAGGELKLCRMARPVRALFELVRMHRIFDIYATRDEAVRALKARREAASSDTQAPQ
jgi:anti-sigma B factor antagonist